MSTEPTEQEQLAHIIDDAWSATEAADAILAAGYSRHRTVNEYGIVFNNHAHGLIPPALSLAEFKERYPNESYWSITDRDVYITRTIQVVDPEPTAWAVHDGGAK